MDNDTRANGVPEHVTQAARELEAMAQRLVPEVLDLADRYERLDWMLDELPAADEPGGAEIRESVARAGFDAGTAAVAVMKLKLQDVMHSIPRPAHLAGDLGFEVPEYPRLVERDLERVRNMRRFLSELDD